MLVKKLIASALCLAAISSASAFSLGGSSEGQRFLMLSINDDERVSSVKEIKEALKYGGSININVEIARKVDPSFRDNLIGSVYCSAQLKAKDFDPEKADPSCFMTTPALLNWVGKYGWSLSDSLFGKAYIMSKPWSKYK